MTIRLEDIRIWRGFDKDVREEILGLIETCRDSSEMNDETHPKNKQYSNALATAARMLGGDTEMKYTVTLTYIKWVEVDVDHRFVAEHQPKTTEEVRSIIGHYFSSSYVFDEEEEKERTAGIVAMYGIKLLHDKNLLASSLEISIKQRT